MDPSPRSDHRCCEQCFHGHVEVQCRVGLDFNSGTFFVSDISCCGRSLIHVRPRFAGLSLRNFQLHSRLREVPSKDAKPTQLHHHHFHHGSAACPSVERIGIALSLLTLCFTFSLCCLFPGTVHARLCRGRLVCCSAR